MSTSGYLSNLLGRFLSSSAFVFYKKVGRSNLFRNTCIYTLQSCFNNHLVNHELLFNYIYHDMLNIPVATALISLVISAFSYHCFSIFYLVFFLLDFTAKSSLRLQ